MKAMIVSGMAAAGVKRSSIQQQTWVADIIQKLSYANRLNYLDGKIGSFNSGLMKLKKTLDVGS
ncbi:MAG TPA: hypothetical protein PLB10_16465 [Thiolinea sp.]|nr:hypothetical protein [Thiolinea sp.]